MNDRLKISFPLFIKSANGGDDEKMREFHFTATLVMTD